MFGPQQGSLAHSVAAYVHVFSLQAPERLAMMASAGPEDFEGQQGFSVEWGMQYADLAEKALLAMVSDKFARILKDAAYAEERNVDVQETLRAWVEWPANWTDTVDMFVQNATYTLSVAYSVS